MQSLNRRYIPELDQLRAFAAILVLLYHSVHTGRATFGHAEWAKANIFDALLVEGHTGVALFMVLSGFVLADGTLGRRLDYRAFIVNRVLRIFPLMTLVVVFSIYANKDVTLSGIVSPFLFLANTQPHLFNDATDLSGPVWTVSVEFQFYLIAPFVFKFTDELGKRYLLGLLALIFILKLIVLFPYRDQPEEMYYITYYTIVGRISQFLVGVLLAALLPKISRSSPERRVVAVSALCLALTCLVVLSYLVNRGGGNTVWHGWMVVYRELEAVLWAVVIASYVIVSPLMRWPRISHFFNSIGVISFSIYILHWSIERDFWSLVKSFGLGPAEPRMPTMVAYAIVILFITLGVSYLSFAVVERPFLTLRRRYIGRPDATMHGDPRQYRAVE